MPSNFFKSMSKSLIRLDKTFLNFKSRPNGDYTERQLAMAAAYTVFCHAEFEIFFESWANDLVDLAEKRWKSRRASRPLVHLCTFHEGRNALTNVPSKDVWNEVVFSSIAKHKRVISTNHGIKESNVCELLSPIGFDTTLIDGILLNDLSAFGGIRGDYAHKSYRTTVGTVFDPFDRKTKVEGIETLLAVLDGQLLAYRVAA